MNIYEQIKIGLKGYSVAMKLVFKAKFLKFFIFPLLLNILIFVIGTNQILDLAEKAKHAFENWVNIDNMDFWGSQFLEKALGGTISFLIYAAFLILFLFIGGYIIVIILSPVFSIMSEISEKEYNPESANFPFEFKQLIKDIFRGIALALRNLSIETGIMIAVFIISFIPVIGLLGSIFMFFISSYFFGFSYMDYTNERYKRKLGQSVSFVRQYRWVAITNGAVFSISLVIPWCGVALSAFVALVSVVAATVSVLEIHKFEEMNNEY